MYPLVVCTCSSTAVTRQLRGVKSRQQILLVQKTMPVCFSRLVCTGPPTTTTTTRNRNFPYYVFPQVREQRLLLVQKIVELFEKQPMYFMRELEENMQDQPT